MGAKEPEGGNLEEAKPKKWPGGCRFQSRLGPGVLLSPHSSCAAQGATGGKACLPALEEQHPLHPAESHLAMPREALELGRMKSAI